MGWQADRRATWGDGGIALLIACILALAACWRDWAQLSALHLPDTDDVMRLQQIRDWLAGQAFDDLSQHRLGVGGLAMHWSRLPDLVPGAMIAVLSRFTGDRTAEIAAVILWPTLLFVTALWLIATITRRLGGAADARTAIIIAAISYPMTTLFLPGRIDHHGFQIVLLLTLMERMLARPSVASGAIAGIAAAASLIIGLETAPFIALASVMLWLSWLADMPHARAWMLGYGAGLATSIGSGALIFSSQQWAYPACDGFTQSAWALAQTAAIAPILLALSTAWLTNLRRRLAATLIVAASIAALLMPTLHTCLSPYAGVDPLLARLWLANVGEAQPLFLAPAAIAFGYVGLGVMGCLASFWCYWRTGKSGWAILLALQLASIGLTLFQLRGAYAGVALAAPALAMLVGAARTRGTLQLAGAWLASAGIFYPLAAGALTPVPPPPVAPHGEAAASCASPALLQALARLRPGTVMAPMDLGPYVIAATRHRVISAPYHRNNAGNLAQYHFYLGTPDAARQIARDLAIDYVVYCPGSLREAKDAMIAPAAATITRLRIGPSIGWLHPAPEQVGTARIFAIKPRLSSPPLPH